MAVARTRCRRALRRTWSTVSRGRAVLLVGALLGTGCGTFMDKGALAPKGPAASDYEKIFWYSTWTAVAVFVVVMGLLLFAMFRPRGEEPSRLDGNRFVFLGGLVIPAVILMGMLGLTVTGLNFTPQHGELEITVIGHQFWWEVYYPEGDFETANEIHIPVGTPVELKLASDDVIHSFWVPELAGKQDLVPGRENRLIIEAEEPGTYRGQCAEYCGLQHANMLIRVIAHPHEEFEAWKEEQTRPAAVRDPRAEDIFQRNCAGCHTIRGTPATGEFGPDLTHLASRETLGSVMIPNERGHLAGWIVNSQTIKPGNEMPPITTLEPEELRLLLDYLEALK